MLRASLCMAIATVFSVAVGVACSATPPEGIGVGVPAAAEDKDEEGGEEDGGVPSLVAHEIPIVVGVPDRGRDPSVLTVRAGTDRLCSGTLVSPRLVLTARRCVSRTTGAGTCPAAGVQVLEDLAPAELAILVGDDTASAREVARGVAILAPGGVTLCDADLAAVVLDQAVTAVKPAPVRMRGPAAGDRLRAVGFGRSGEPGEAGQKLVREHVRVRGVSAAEFTLAEAACQGDAGGPALDEDTGEVIGVASRGGPACSGDDVHVVYTRLDAYAWLIEEAFTRVSEIDVVERADAGASNPTPRPARRGTRQRPPSDTGGPCARGDDCAAGICIAALADDAGAVRRYCSRACGPGDRCPTRYHCKRVTGLERDNGCVNVR